jgi:hypothetical protein
MKNFFVFLFGALIGAAIVYFVYCKSTDMVQVADAPKGLITPAEASALDQAFNSRHKLISDSIVKRPDNRSSWYSLTDLRAYLTLAEKEANGLGYDMNGVRVYLGAYPNTANEVGYTTMFFIPTGTKNLAEGNMNFLNLNFQLGTPDIPGGKGLNGGDSGYPPDANYPQ